MTQFDREPTADMDSLWNAYAANKTVELRNQLAEHYLPLVKMVAGRLAISLPPHVDREDLLSSGFFGLLDAIDRYDLQRKNKFETYAGVRIRGAMLDYLREKDWVPVTMRQKIRKYEQTAYQLENELGRSPTDEELAAAMELNIEELHTLVGQLNAATVIPLDEYLRGDAPEMQEAGPEQRAERKELQMTLAAAIDRLPEKERTVVALYYYEEMTLKEISLILHLSEARISQLHTKAVFRMRGYLARMKASLL